MSKTKDLIENIRKTQESKNSFGHSNKDLYDISATMLNDREYESDKITNDDGKISHEKGKPVEDFRDALAKDVSSTLHLDKDDQERVRDMSFSNKTAKAMTDLGIEIVSGYLETGRKLNLPTTSEECGKSSIQMKEVKEKVTETHKIVDGAQVPTGNKVTTHTHRRVKASAKAYPWQKTTTKI